jgi:LmbE family N-acetylglucosaminyl deacetylase
MSAMATIGGPVLFLSPHTDDVEIGCGGTLARFIADPASEVYVAAFSSAEESLPVGVPKNILRKEFAESMKTYGIKRSNIHLLKHQVRTLHEHRQEILDFLISLRKTICPSIVFAPSGNDIHQDHQVIHNEAVRAFKDHTIFGYELPWNNLTFNCQAFFTLNEEHVAAKINALSMYKSQINLKRHYFQAQSISSWARMRGMQINSEYAEAFEVIRIKL